MFENANDCLSLDEIESFSFKVSQILERELIDIVSPCNFEIPFSIKSFKLRIFSTFFLGPPGLPGTVQPYNITNINCMRNTKIQ